MSNDNVPSDLIQEVVDILRSDNNHVEVYTQNVGFGSVLILTGDVIRLDGDNYLFMRNIRIKGAGGEPGEFAVHLSNVIQIRPVAAEGE